MKTLLATVHVSTLSAINSFPATHSVFLSSKLGTITYLVYNSIIVTFLVLLALRSIVASLSGLADVAGTMAAIRNNGRGVYGVVDNVNLFITRVFFESGEASFGSSVIAAARKCRDQGAHIINMSLGGFRPTIVERKAYESIARSGILIVAAAGNEFSNECVYPGAYPSVLSVAAVDSNKAVPSFSSHHNQVELSAPGVAVWSTVPLSESDTIGSVIINGMTFIANPMIGSNRGTVSGALVDCGQGIEEQDVGSCDNNVAAGRICLMVRGGGSFAQKVRFCERNGGVAAIVYNNNTGPIRGTLGNYQSTIPAITLLQSEGRNIVENFAPSIATISVELTRYYASLQGTSMATPHVSGVAALIWSHHPSCTASQIRDIMACTSEDLGSKGHDNYYGYGLVQAQAALNLLNQNGCGACTGFVSLRECQVKRPVGLESCSSRDRCNCGRNQCFTIHRITRTRSCRSLCAGGIMLRLRLIFRYDCGACPSTLNVPDEATAVL